MENFIKIEQKEITLSSKVIVTDPCYSMQHIGGVLKIRPGKYVATQKIYNDEYSHPLIGRVGLLEVWRKGTTPDYNNLEKTDFAVGVDSGTAGVITYKEFTRLHNEGLHRSWYSSTMPFDENGEIPLTSEEIKELEKYASIRDSIFTSKEDFSNETKQFEYWIATQKFEKELRDKYSIEFPNTSLKTKTKKIFQYKLATTNCSAFSSTGYGDGSYPCYIHRNEKGEIDGILIDYLDFFEENFE